MQNQLKAFIRKEVSQNLFGDAEVDFASIFSTTFRSHHRKTALSRHNPFLVEQLLRDIVGSLDRLLAYQTEGFDLIAKAVVRDLEYQMLETTIPLDEKLTLKQLELWGDDGSATELVASKFAAISKYQRTLQVFYNTPGHGLHYSERYKNIKELFKHETEIVARKLYSCQEGLSAVYGIDVGAVPRKLEQLVVWVRGVLDDVEIVIDNTYEFTSVIPMVQPTRKKSNAIMSLKEWNDYRDIKRGNLI